MAQITKQLLLAAGAAALSLPAGAHVASSADPHLHAGDGWGLLAVAVLTAVAAWIGRRGR